MARMARARQIDTLIAQLGDPDPDVTWKLDGRCAETDPHLFFPDKGEDTTAARAVCAGCEVRLRCLEYAINTRERFGVWGGATERERRQIQHTREAAA